LNNGHTGTNAATQHWLGSFFCAVELRLIGNSSSLATAASLRNRQNRDFRKELQRITIDAQEVAEVRFPRASKTGCLGVYDKVGTMPARFPIWTASALVAAVSMMGCVPLSPAGKTPSQLPPARLPPDAVVVDIAFLRLPPDGEEIYETIWEAADEQWVPIEVRRELAANGLRAGIFGQQLPLRLRQLLDAPQARLTDLGESPSGMDLGSTRQHLPLRAGHRSVVQVSQPAPTLAVLISESGSVRGYQLTDARCTMALKAYPLGDGRAKLSLTPEVEHGEAKSRWTGSEGMMIQQTTQERLVLDRLTIAPVLGPGQWLVLSATPEVKGLGEHFFAHQAASNVNRRIVVIRYSQTQFDDLLVPEQTTARLATPGD
jgi:hypothetical protein